MFKVCTTPQSVDPPYKNLARSTNLLLFYIGNHQQNLVSMSSTEIHSFIDLENEKELLKNTKE